MLVNPSIRKVTYEHSIRFEDFESVTSCFNRLSQSQWTDAKNVSERLGITQQTYARLEANPASAGFERLFRVFSVLGVEIVLSSSGTIVRCKARIRSYAQLFFTSSRAGEMVTPGASRSNFSSTRLTP